MAGLEATAGRPHRALSRARDMVLRGVVAAAPKLPQEVEVDVPSFHSSVLASQARVPLACVRSWEKLHADRQRLCNR